METRGGSLQNPSKKQWRAVSDSLNVGDATDFADLQQLKLNQTDERTIYENGELLEQQLLNVSREKGELQQLEIELRDQMIARQIQSNFESQFTEYANAAARMQEQLHEKERSIREAERKLEEKDRELHAIKLDNEAAWAKEGILREQNKELATFRRERDQSEAERSQNIHQISELQEHIQEKERQFTELQEQNRIAQETIMYKDEQLREAQAWIVRAQEMDALQSSTNHSLQAELRERTEQYNQLWLGCQRQFAEMDRLHLHTVQQLQLQLANVTEGGGSITNSNGASQIIQNSGNQIEAVPDSSQMPVQNHVHPSQGGHGLTSSDAKSEYQVPANGQSLGQGPQGYLDVQTSHGAQHGSTTPSSSVSEQIVESGNGGFQDISSQFRDALRLDSNALNQKPEEADGQASPGEQNGIGSIVRETLVSSGKLERNLESALLDEKSLLACIVRTIPAGGRIKITPLHWHDYKKKYGKLDDFVASHVELFVIEDDYIQVREGAQKMVAASASASAAKVAAATASSFSNSMYVAMTPMAQPQGSKKNDKTVQRGRQL
ncbi:unnamed protein product [Thlaspi arvense]|uniref:DUF7725 domain-containing protein n=1 Tax=Thlaspi arvense TaxID=13288 RepID=A0AAU9SNC9_THLAR|nr:unnamed protein product [Thlaspi arvense]